MPKLRRLERLIIYSFLSAATYGSKIRALSKSERKLTQDSAIALENKNLTLKVPECVSFEGARIKFLLDCAETCEIDIRPPYGKKSRLDVTEIGLEDKITVRILKLVPERMYNARISIYFKECTLKLSKFMDLTASYLETSKIFFKKVLILGIMQGDDYGEFLKEERELNGIANLWRDKSDDVFDIG